MKIRMCLRTISLYSVAAGFAMLSSVNIGAAGNSFIVSQWPLYQTDAYAVYITPAATASRADAFTTGWLSLDLHAPVFDGSGNIVTFSQEFSQVGSMAKFGLLFWFVYAEKGVFCTRGVQAPPDGDGISRGCNGQSGDLVFVNQTNGVALYRLSNGQWAAQVNSILPFNEPFFVAFIGSVSFQIYNAQVDAEEGYDTAPDPQLFMRYFFYHPLVNVPGQGYLDWPGPANLYPFTTIAGVPVCPVPYGAYFGDQGTGIGGDPRYWFAGTNGPVCFYTIP